MSESVCYHLIRKPQCHKHSLCNASTVSELELNCLEGLIVIFRQQSRLCSRGRESRVSHCDALKMPISPSVWFTYISITIKFFHSPEEPLSTACEVCRRIKCTRAVRSLATFLKSVMPLCDLFYWCHGKVLPQLSSSPSNYILLHSITFWCNNI